MERDRDRDWGIVQNAGRLKIHTFDGLCAALVQQMPIVSELGGLPEVSESPTELYEGAARRTLAAGESELAAPIGLMLLHLDNDRARLTGFRRGDQEFAVFAHGQLAGKSHAQAIIERADIPSFTAIVLCPTSNIRAFGSSFAPRLA